MSSSDPKDPEDWETFRFPTRPVLAFEQVDNPARSEDDEEGEGDAGGAGGMELRPRRGRWEYRSESRTLCSPAIGKQIRLDDFDQVQKIVRLLTVLQERTDYDIDSLIDALETASQDCYGHDLGQVLADHRWGVRILWKPMILEDKIQSEADFEERLKSRHTIG